MDIPQYPSSHGARPRTLRDRLRWLVHVPVLDQSWDAILYVCAITGVATALACAVFPRITELAVFGWLMFLASGPTATFLPSASEPLLMAFGRLYPPLLLAVVGTLGVALVELVNYRVFGAVMLAQHLAPVRSARLTRRLASWFAAQPFATTVVAALTPIPFWVARICAVLSGYPMGRFIAGTALGRFPRIWFFAFVGTALPVSTSAILVGGAVVVLGAAVVAARRRSSSPVVDSGPLSPNHVSNHVIP